MVKPAPLKEKTEEIEGCDLIKGEYFMKEDVAAAVAWLKADFRKGLTFMGEVSEISEFVYKEFCKTVDAAFEDVVEVKE